MNIEPLMNMEPLSIEPSQAYQLNPLYDILRQRWPNATGPALRAGVAFLDLILTAADTPQFDYDAIEQGQEAGQILGKIMKS